MYLRLFIIFLSLICFSSCKHHEEQGGTTSVGVPVDPDPNSLSACQSFVEISDRDDVSDITLSIQGSGEIDFCKIEEALIDLKSIKVKYPRPPEAVTYFLQYAEYGHGSPRTYCKTNEGIVQPSSDLHYDFCLFRDGSIIELNTLSNIGIHDILRKYLEELYL